MTPRTPDPREGLELVVPEEPDEEWLRENRRFWEDVERPLWRRLLGWLARLVGR